MHKTGNLEDHLRSDQKIYGWKDGLRAPRMGELRGHLHAVDWIELPSIDHLTRDEVWDPETGGPWRFMSEERLVELCDPEQRSLIQNHVHRLMLGSHVGCDRLRWVAYLVSEPREIEKRTRRWMMPQNATHEAIIATYIERPESRWQERHSIWSDCQRLNLADRDLELVIRCQAIEEVELEGFVITT